MGKYYKREISLMNQSIYPRTSLDKPIENPNINNSTEVLPHEKTDQEIVQSVVSNLRKIGTLKTETS